ncbi:ATP-binding protein [Natrialbaceae archaeon A-gly3]
MGIKDENSVVAVETCGQQLAARTGRLGPTLGIAAVGGFLSSFPIVHAIGHTGEEPLLANALGVVLPLALSLLVVTTACWLYETDLEAGHLRRVLGWCVVGTGGMATVAVVMIGHLWLEGHGPAVSVHAIANVAAGGAVFGILLGTYDARRLRQTELTEASERRFQSVFDGTLDALLLTNDDGEYVEANPAACELLGAPREELLGRSVAGVTPADDDVIAEMWEEFLESGEQRGEFPVIRADGEERVVEFAATANVQPGRHLSALRDVTDRKESEEALLAERETVEFLNQVLRHEVLNAMNVILAEAQFVRERADEEDRERVDAILARGDHVVTVIQNVRSIVETLTDDDQLTAVDLSRVLEDVLEDARTSFPDATITVDGEIPEDVVVTANGLLASVFENLVHNAIRHNDREPVVTVGVETAGRSVRVAVADNGPGIPDEDKREVFGKGERGIKSPGSGFGLYIADTLVTHFGGDVELEDNDPRGAVFTVSLPLTDGDAGDV